LAAFGITSYDFISGGTGSGDVNEAYTVSLCDGLNNAGYQINNELLALYNKYITDENEKNKPDPNNGFAMFMPKVRASELVVDASLLKKTASETDAALITIGRTSGEFMDRKINDFNLTEKEQQLIQNVCKTFHAAGKKVVVILNIGGVIETATWKQYPDAVVLAWQAGQEGGNSVTDILSGKANPSGKLPMTFPVNYMDIASLANFPYDYTPSSANLMSGSSGEKTPMKNVDYTNYEEDIFVGYRYFDTFGKEVSFHFGYGLSYTNFEYSKPVIKDNKNNSYTVSLTVKNTGKKAGKEVVQLYVSAPQNQLLQKPSKELKAFAKTKELKPGEKQTVDLTFSALDLASFNENESAWITDAGEYKLQVGSSSQDIQSSLVLSISKQVTEKTHNVVSPMEAINLLRK
jgi:beta-glucosidase